MTMNKKERSDFDAAIKAVYVARALNWSPPVAPDLVPTNGMRGELRGFVFNTYNDSILHALTGSVSHATSRDEPPKKTTSQRAISMYSTRLLALRGLRSALENEFAGRLAKIDMEIEKEVAEAFIAASQPSK